MAATANASKVREYTIVLTPEPEEGGYSVTVPTLPGCFTQGDTFEEAVTNAREAIRCHVNGLAKDGLPVPEEEAHPAITIISV